MSGCAWVAHLLCLLFICFLRALLAFCLCSLLLACFLLCFWFYHCSCYYGPFPGNNTRPELHPLPTITLIYYTTTHLPTSILHVTPWSQMWSHHPSRQKRHPLLLAYRLHMRYTVRLGVVCLLVDPWLLRACAGYRICKSVDINRRKLSLKDQKGTLIPLNYR